MNRLYIRALVVSALGLAIVAVSYFVVHAAEVEKEQPAPLELTIAVPIEDRPQHLLFRVTNTSENPVTIHPFCQNNNYIYFIRPDGSRYTVRSINFPHTVTLQPAETKIRKVGFDALFYSQTKQGVYRLRWTVNDVQSNEVVLYREKDKEVLE